MSRYMLVHPHNLKRAALSSGKTYLFPRFDKPFPFGLDVAAMDSAYGYHADLAAITEEGWIERFAELHRFSVFFGVGAVKGYTAAKVVLRSALLLEPPYYGTPETDALEDWVGFLKIMNESGYDAGDYMGVVLETQSMLVGAGRVYFSDPGIQDGAATVPAARQIVVASTEGAVSVA